MIGPELDREITVTTDFAKEFERLAKLSSERHQLEIEKAAMGRELRRLTFVLSENDGSDPTRRAEIAARIQGIPIQIEEMDRRGVELEGELESLRVKIDRAYNPRWGSLFREGNESSRFGHQLKDFACVYTSRVSNFLHYPWNYYFNPRRVHAARHLGERRVDRLEAVPKLSFVTVRGGRAASTFSWSRREERDPPRQWLRHQTAERPRGPALCLPDRAPARSRREGPDVPPHDPQRRAAIFASPLRALFPSTRTCPGPPVR
jgi:hypothetical protein